MRLIKIGVITTICYCLFVFAAGEFVTWGQLRWIGEWDKSDRGFIGYIGLSVVAAVMWTKYCLDGR